MSDLLSPLFRAPRATILFGDQARLQGMLDFEAALARAEAQAGMIPAAAAEAIAGHCRAELLDAGALAEATGRAGNPVIPLVAALTRSVAAVDAAAAAHVHRGATSQDAMDTGLVLQLRAFIEVLAADLERLSAALARLANAHRATPICGRTWLQQAAPTVFGLKAAGFLDALERHLERLRELRPRLLVLQFGGAVGTLGSLESRGPQVAEALSRELQLGLPEMPWHAHRDRLVELAAWLGLLVGTLGKMARDLALLAQGEVAEAFEAGGEGRGGSSAMPQKRNPVSAAVVLAAAARAPGLVATLLSAMVQEHERGLGGWHAEWETLPELSLLAAGAAHQSAAMVETLEVDPARMRENLTNTRGLVFAEAVASRLAPRAGRTEAHELVARASRKALAGGRQLRAVLEEDPEVARHLSAGDLSAIFDSGDSPGSAGLFIDRVLDRRRRRLGVP
ncbi:MAG TPA: 3-carboxy-cis,cis-muconate cycloisomerase [Myxococcales bacterium]|nr:3-carboxy-cis,cis-muconate cycloisomerase [Myxococcales bacterium]